MREITNSKRKEQLRKASNKYRTTHREQILARKKKYRKIHSKDLAVKQKKYRETNPALYKKYEKDYKIKRAKYCAEHRDQHIARCKISNAKRIKILSDSYVASTLRISAKDCPKDLLEAHRMLIKCKRALKEYGK